ncbi:winged helix-turn-helix domain-containing protein [Pseudomonas panipatensis]|uniref:DNA-binding response regulator, OmpR family, contains REC and winged-helix (WHTH) domain n=1 Tax=Pseudomonas panipatensis TaxID=428992 RepID=A0A1G8MNX3_9PSED|nr:winged helix-turn-helix domain-containing protein [Pseudomonas panipatensis]SDI69729.1 DNA-binding response regulator, OmpR family, contains REC and winged-helix (wHTH) domain [Pseudomonas panipatensis]SMP77677.1 DNA-binding response regulator, OmpR family, contains REC and winged-helix (wHTH) domain [Pseudomonas panipatensis]
MSLLYVTRDADGSRARDLPLAASYASPEQARHLMTTGQFQLVVLELPAQYPALLSLCAAPRGQAALLVLHGCGASNSVACLRAGADLCLPVEVSARELRARVQALLRSVPAPADAIGLWLSLGLPQLGLGARRVELTRDEQRLLELFGRHGGVIPIARLEEALWGDGGDIQPARLQRRIAALRRKLAELGAGDCLETLRGYGYRLKRSLLLRER